MSKLRDEWTANQLRLTKEKKEKEEKLRRETEQKARDEEAKAFPAIGRSQPIEIKGSWKRSKIVVQEDESSEDDDPINDNGLPPGWLLLPNTVIWTPQQTEAW